MLKVIYYYLIYFGFHGASITFYLVDIIWYFYNHTFLIQGTFIKVAQAALLIDYYFFYTTWKPLRNHYKQFFEEINVCLKYLGSSHLEGPSNFMYKSLDKTLLPSSLLH